MAEQIYVAGNILWGLCEEMGEGIELFGQRAGWVGRSRVWFGAGAGGYGYAGGEGGEGRGEGDGEWCGVVRLGEVGM